MKRTATRFSTAAGLALIGGLLVAPSARALELDWSGQFRAEANLVHNYALDSGNNNIPDGNRVNAKGYYIRGGGEGNAYFQNLFMRLRPKIVVNDNIYIKSEFWLGDPVYGMFGNAVPYTTDQTQFYSNQSRGSIITAQRFWAEYMSDIGTAQVGRAPLNWGLGIVWNNGDGIWDKYQSTGDVIRLVSKFGAFTFSPAIIKYSQGNNIGGAFAPSTNGGTGTAVSGGGGMEEYSVSAKYENPDEDFEGGVNFIKRLSGPAQDRYVGWDGKGAGMHLNIWDIYARKKFGTVSLGAEVPLTSGDVEGAHYSTYAAALEGNWKISDSWETNVRAGHAPGQPNIVNPSPSDFKAFFFNPNYRLGLIMFNYQLANFAGPNTTNNSNVSGNQLASPYDNPIVNANYLSLNLAYHLEKWHFHGNYIYAKANEVATQNGYFYNTWSRQFVAYNGGNAQSNSLGWEMDYGLSFQWDDNFIFAADTGFFFPGDFYKFSNTTTDNALGTVWATVFRVGTTF